MIQINRTECPEILKNSPRRKSYYNNEQVTFALHRMQYGKCAYCEKLLKDNAQVDHFIPLESFVTGRDN